MVYEAFIQFKDGKVVAYGRLDDFDSTRHKELLIKKAEGKKLSGDHNHHLLPIAEKNNGQKSSTFIS